MQAKKFRIILAEPAERDLERLERRLSLRVCQDISSYLETNPTPIGKPRIKKLSGFHPPLYRMRSGDIRVYYRFQQGEVVILAVRLKRDSEKFLKRIEEERRAYQKKPAAKSPKRRRNRAGEAIERANSARLGQGQLGVGDVQ